MQRAGAFHRDRILSELLNGLTSHDDLCRQRLIRHEPSRWEPTDGTVGDCHNHGDLRPVRRRRWFRGYGNSRRGGRHASVSQVAFHPILHDGSGCGGCRRSVDHGQASAFSRSICYDLHDHHRSSEFHHPENDQEEQRRNKGKLDRRCAWSLRSAGPANPLQINPCDCSNFSHDPDARVSLLC